MIWRGKRMNKVSLLLFGTTLAFGASTVVLMQKLRDAEQRNQALQARIVEPADPRVEESVEVAGTTPDVATDETAQAQSTASSNQKPAAADPTKKQNAKWTTRWLEKMRDPKYRAARIVAMRLDLEEQNPDLPRVLGLSPQESAEFFELLARHELEDQERNILEGTGAWKGESLEERQQRLRQVSEKVDAERLAVLGPQRLETWNEYVETAPTRQAVNDLRLKLVDAGVPLRADQVDPLVEDLSSELKRHRAQTEELRAGRRGIQPPVEYAAFMKERTKLVEEHLDKAHDIASAHLTSNQLEVFDQMLEQQRRRAQAELAGSQAYAKSQGGG